MDDIVTVLREHLKRPEMMHTTHWDGCMESHTICALAWSLDEIERLREKVQDLRMYAEQDACEIERLRAEVARLGSFLHPIGMVIDGQFSSTSETAWKRDD